MSTEFCALAVIATLFVFSIISLYKKLLNAEGILVANIFGLATYLIGGFYAFVTLVVFFAVAEFATKIGRQVKGVEHEKRSVANIIGNGLPALVALALHLPLGFYAGISAALSDTMSSEIGMCSKHKPRLITDLKKEVDCGTDGGVTILGLFAGLLGAALIGIMYFLFFDAQNKLLDFGIITVCGLFGCIIDSLLGAIFELKGKLNNTQVNLLGSTSGILLAVVMMALLQS